MPGRGPSTGIAVSRVSRGSSKLAARGAGALPARSCVNLPSSPVFSHRFAQNLVKGGVPFVTPGECAVLIDTLQSGNRKNSAKVWPPRTDKGAGEFALTVKSGKHGTALGRLDQDGHGRLSESARAVAQLATGAGCVCESRAGLGAMGLDSVQHSYFMAPVR
jgi:hypothetical protein